MSLKIKESNDTNTAYEVSKTVFVGDAGTDMKAAEATGLLFIGRNTPENAEIFKDVKYRVDDLREISGILESETSSYGAMD